jgi:hypothetical protein
VHGDGDAAGDPRVTLEEAAMQIVAPTGWYPDPEHRHTNRYWSDGAWSEHVADDGISAVEPVARDVLAAFPPPDPTSSGFAWARGPAGYRVGPCDPGIPLFTMLAQTSGSLELAFGRLRFTTPRGRVIFDLPLSELHSLGVGEFGTAIDVWHGDKRHRVSLAGAPEFMLPPMYATDPLTWTLGVTSGVEQFRREKETTRVWRELLQPYVAADAPPGVKVRRPMGNVAYATSVMSLVILTTILICAVTFAVLAL